MKKKLVILVTVLLTFLTGCNLIDKIAPDNLKKSSLDISYDAPKDNIVEDVLSYPFKSYKNTKTINIKANGDIMFHGTQIKSAYKDGKYDFNDNFKYIKEYIQSADLAIGNFETTTAGGTPTGYPVFNAPDETLEALKNAGYDILSTANNHCLDKGKNGIIRTLEKIQENGMVSVGTYKEPTEDRFYITEIEGIKLGILSYTYGLNGMDFLLTDEERSYMINLIDEERIKEDISKVKEKGVDFTIVLIHWGNEYQLEPSNYQVDLANKMFNWGADIILGSHPHVVQKSEMVEVDGKMKYVIYSMGNFISNQRRETLNSIANRNYTEDGVIVDLTLEKDMLTGETRIKSVNYIPTWVYRGGTSGNYDYYVLPADGKTDFNLDGNTKAKLEQSYQNTINKMSLYRYNR